VKVKFVGGRSGDRQVSQSRVVTENSGTKKSPRANPPLSERTAAVQTVVLDPSRHTGILPGRTFRTPSSKLEPSTRGPGRTPNNAGMRHRWSRFLLIIRNVRAFSKKNLLDKDVFFEILFQERPRSPYRRTRSMADHSKKPDNWVDELFDKHECGSYYHEPIRYSVDHAGKKLTLLLPYDLEEVTILSSTTSRSGDLLYLVGKRPLEDSQPPYEGLLLVGRRRAPDTYAIVVWHTLYPWALGYLGLDENTV
jgi:hypothetical protein